MIKSTQYTVHNKDKQGPIFLNDEKAGKMLLFFYCFHFENTCAHPPF